MRFSAFVGAKIFPHTFPAAAYHDIGKRNRSRTAIRTPCLMHMPSNRKENHYVRK